MSPDSRWWPPCLLGVASRPPRYHSGPNLNARYIQSMSCTFPDCFWPDQHICRACHNSLILWRTRRDSNSRLVPERGNGYSKPTDLRCRRRSMTGSEMLYGPSCTQSRVQYVLCRFGFVTVRFRATIIRCMLQEACPLCATGSRIPTGTGLSETCQLRTRGRQDTPPGAAIAGRAVIRT